jgi:hypothetical protein
VPFWSEPGEALFAVSACHTCKRTFAYNPDLVPSVLVDPATGYPPDNAEHPGDPDRAVARPLCRRCVDMVNRRRPGHITVLPGAYPAER